MGLKENKNVGNNCCTFYNCFIVNIFDDPTAPNYLGDLILTNLIINGLNLYQNNPKILLNNINTPANGNNSDYQYIIDAVVLEVNNKLVNLGIGKAKFDNSEIEWGIKVSLNSEYVITDLQFNVGSLNFEPNIIKIINLKKDKPCI